MTFVAAPKKGRDFDPKNFLATIGEGRKAMLFPKKQTIFTQGDPVGRNFLSADGQGKTHLCLQNWQGSDDRHIEYGSFFGEGSLAGQPLRMGTATAMTDCTVLRIKKRAMVDTLHPGTHPFRSVRRIFVDTEHPIRRGSG